MYPIANDLIQVNLVDVKRGTNTEVLQKVLLQVYAHELHTEMLNKYSTGFSMVYDEKVLVWISDFDIWLLLQPILRIITQ